MNVQPLSVDREAAKVSWRVGRKVWLNVYEGDRPVCQCHTPEDAARIVGLLNAADLQRKCRRWTSPNRNAGVRMESART